MKLCYWHGTVPNFGDDLNGWLWPRLLPDFFDGGASVLFIGIGSILYHDYPPAATKIVFGSGYGGYSAPPQVDTTWDVFFVRGPRTAQTLGLEPRLGIGDAATLLRTVAHDLPAPDQRARVGFMPHWQSAIYGAWETISADVGFRFIDPRWPVERVLAAIRGCDLLVTEAMHGAITADALRVPWVPFLPLAVHRNKWFDWAESQRLDVQFSTSARSTWLEAASLALERRGRMQRAVRTTGVHVRNAGRSFYRARAAAALQTASASRSYLTSDARISSTTDAMLECLDRLRSQYGPATRR